MPYTLQNEKNKRAEKEHEMISNILRFSLVNQLKTIERANTVIIKIKKTEGTTRSEDNIKRKESSAEHSWSTGMLADYFMAIEDYNLDKLKVHELIRYHDLVETKAGDMALRPGQKNVGKKERELAAAHELRVELPIPLNEMFWENFEEFENQQTIEAKFAKAMDAFDAVIHELDHKEDWKGWTRGFLIEKKAKFFKPFPAVEKSFYEVLDYMEEEGYFK